VTPVLVTGGLSFRVVRAGLHHSCGIVTTGRVVCWGYNRFGQLGDGSRFDRAEPGDVLYGERFFEEEPDGSGEVNEAVAALLKGRLIPARPRS
jgi:alpha-tubulin suppressor-like RCC1 family protein